jgi:uncharacterized peroxidase-related enzyme
MRLAILEHGHSRRNRLALRVMRAVAGAESDDVIKTSLYRPAFFGRPWIRLLRSVMRGPSEWSAGERELFGAFTSRLNTCRYCVGVHLGTTALTLDPAITVERLDHWREAGFAPRIVATLDLLAKVTRTPDQLSRADIEPVLAAGVSESAIVDALHVCFVFNVVNRLANALDYDAGSAADALKLAVILNRVGYQLPGFLLR